MDSASGRTHLGALYAALGRPDLAVRAFDEGDAVLPIEKCYDSVLGSIRFVLCIQAACSLQRIGHDDDAHKFETRALAVVDRFAATRLFQLMRTGKWLEMLQAQAEPRLLPKFYY